MQKDGNINQVQQGGRGYGRRNLPPLLHSLCRKTKTYDRVQQGGWVHMGVPPSMCEKQNHFSICCNVRHKHQLQQP